MQREKSSHVQIITARQVYAQAVAEEQKHSQKFSGVNNVRFRFMKNTVHAVGKKQKE